MQKPPLPIKQHTKLFKSPDNNEFLLTTPPKDLSLFSQIPPFEENPINNEKFEKFLHILQEKTEEVELLKSKLGVSELVNSQLKSSKTKLLSDLQENSSENRIENTRIKSILEEKLREIDILSTKLIKHSDLLQENANFQAKFSELDHSFQLLTLENSKGKEMVIELEAENSLLKSQRKTLESEYKETKSLEKTANFQIMKKNEQIESLRRYLNNLEYKFKDLEKIKLFEKNLVLMGVEIERLQRLLSHKCQENEALKTKLLETQKSLKLLANYEKTISNLAIENEKLKNDRGNYEEKALFSPRSFEFKGKNHEKTHDFNDSSKEKTLRNPQQVLYEEIDRMNGLFKNEHQDFETINREYQRVMKENVGFIEKFDGFERQLGQMKVLLMGKEREIQELRLSRKGDDEYLERTLEKKPFGEENNTSRKFTD